MFPYSIWFQKTLRANTMPQVSTNCFFFIYLFYNFLQHVTNCRFDKVCVKPQSHIHGFGPGRATVHPDLASR